MALSVCVIGAGGQVSEAIADRAGDALRVVNVPQSVMDLAETDVLKDKLAAVIRSGGPFDAVINAAAYTAVDKAEDDEVTALAVNGIAPGIMAELCAEEALPFLHISTDYVFDGDKQSPYLESDVTGPTGAYGRTKLEGERLVMAGGGNAFIGRTAWVYSEYGHNFVKTMLSLRDRERLGVVADQIGNPTYAGDIADCLIRVAHQMADGKQGGLCHMAGTGSTSWHGFAEAVFEIAERKDGGPRPRVDAITSPEFPTPAKRPLNSRLDCTKLFDTFDVELPFWRDSLVRCAKFVEEA